MKWSILKDLILSLTLLEIVSCTPLWYLQSDGKRYLIDTEAKYNWHEAMHACARLDAQLVSIENEVKWKRLSETLDWANPRKIHLWIGGHDELSSAKSTSRPMYWSASGLRFTFTHWSKNNPNNANGNEHCVHILSSQEWNDYSCTDKKGFLCEKDRFLETYQNNLDAKHFAVQKKNAEISQDFEKLQEQQLIEITKKLQDIENIGNEMKAQIEYLQNNTQIPILNKYLEEQLNGFQTIAEYHEALKNSTESLNKEFAKNLNVKLNEVNNIIKN